MSILERGYHHDRYRRVTAAHEAAHAVVAEALGVRVEHVSIVPNEDSDGRIYFAHSSTPSAARVAATLAGGMVRARHEHISSNAPSSVDREQAYEEALAVSLAATGSHGEANRVIEQAEKRAAELIEEHHDVISRVADALMERGELTGSELRSEMARAVDAQTPSWFVGSVGDYEAMQRTRELEKIGVKPSATDGRESQRKGKASAPSKAKAKQSRPKARNGSARRYVFALKTFTYSDSSVGLVAIKAGESVDASHEAVKANPSAFGRVKQVNAA
jgi:hypothetical protein